MSTELTTLRKRIDAIDRALVRMLGRRAQCSLRIGRMKQAAGMRLFSHAREREIAHNIRRVNRGPLSGRALTDFYSMLLRLTRHTVHETLRHEKSSRKSPRKGRK